MPVGEIRDVFREIYGRDPEVVGIAPGRINLIGEHTDYNDGFVFPAAIDRGLAIAACVSDGPSKTYSVQLGNAEEFDVADVKPGFTETWSKYGAGMGWAISDLIESKLPNLNVVVDSEIPIGSGVSSSAALELAFGVVWNYVEKLTLDNRELARLGQICENRFVGVNSGIMDQMASAMGRNGHAMFLDTRTLQMEYVKVPSDLAVVLCDTKKERALTTSAYNERRTQCETAAQYLGVRKLRDADMKLLDSTKRHLPEVVYRRAKHVITENQRCVDFKEALRGRDYEAIGRLMKESHVSLRDDYEVSCAELDAMAEAAWAAPGCVGARMTGAGFGGACVALVQKDLLNPFITATLSVYELATGREGDAMSCIIVDGARLLEA